MGGRKLISNEIKFAWYGLCQLLRGFVCLIGCLGVGFYLFLINWDIVGLSVILSLVKNIVRQAA